MNSILEIILVSVFLGAITAGILLATLTIIIPFLAHFTVFIMYEIYGIAKFFLGYFIPKSWGDKD